MYSFKYFTENKQSRSREADEISRRQSALPSKLDVDEVQSRVFPSAYIYMVEFFSKSCFSGAFEIVCAPRVSCLPPTSTSNE